MKTWHIHIQGQVQGVGFRPFVYRLAHQYGLNGWVNNTLDGVHVEIAAPEPVARAFYRDCTEQAPALARIIRHSLVPLSTEKDFQNFEIVHSEPRGRAALLLSPDFGLCPACRSEIHQPGNRRHQYAFTTCTLCGPRYSIVSGLPYDRPRTSMSAFQPCPECLREYENPDDRRYYSQTNSCPVCGIRLQYLSSGGTALSGESAWRQVVTDWEAGRIVAIKGIGGYLLTCDATRAGAIARLRKMKNRPAKPFALMYPGTDQLREDARIRPASLEVLQSPASPIGLFSLKDTSRCRLALDQIAPGLDEVGIMLPYTPLYELLLKAFGKPVVATSGNRSGFPIVYRDDRAKELLAPISDALLANDREILIPQDDSVVRFTESGRRILLRRSRGYAPTLLLPGMDWGEETVLACGAMLKSTLSFLHRQQVYASQYLGNLEQFDTLQHFQATARHLGQILRAKPERLLVDRHPDYPSTRFGKELAEREGLPVHEIQHHEAHLAAILGEHRLWADPEPVLGVIWDGTGYGADGQIWGGECFRYRQGFMDRVGHLEAFPLLLGDKMVREARLSALAIAGEVPGSGRWLNEKFNAREWDLYLKMLRQGTKWTCTSLGRLFDGVSSLLGLCDRVGYEGEAAMRLEKEARQYRERHSAGWSPYDLAQGSASIFPTRTLVGALLEDLAAGRPSGEMALRFHQTLAEWPGRLAGELGIRRLAFSGGVFQNALLVDLLQARWGRTFDLYFHEQLSPNDECISVGQLVHWHIRSTFSHQKEKANVLSYSGKN